MIKRLCHRTPLCLALFACLASSAPLTAADDPVPLADVEGQPLAANVERLVRAMRFLGAPLPDKTTAALAEARRVRDSRKIQQVLDAHVLLAVSLNPEVRVKVTRGPAAADLQQGGYTPVLVKVINHSTVTRQLQIRSPQGGPVYSGASLAILRRQAQTELNENDNQSNSPDRFLDLEMFRAAPMTRTLSGLEVEYAIALIYSNESGKREATIGFDVGAGTQDLGFRGETPVLFSIKPAIPVQLKIRDHDGQPTTARLTFQDRHGHVYPAQAKRLAPDFFFQPQIYRADGDVVLLPPGNFQVRYCRGPEYRELQRDVTIPATGPASLQFDLKRWIRPSDFGYYSGDHHIHGAGCSHYESPTQGVTPQDMFRQVKGEGLNVGCVLTWGPCFDFQRNFFSPKAAVVSQPLTVLKYDLEISGFGSAALGHVCLLNLKDQNYPGSDGTKSKGWPTWTVPVMRWAKQQGGVTGYPHSAMHVNPQSAALRLLETMDQDANGTLSAEESRNTAGGGILPDAFNQIDRNRDLRLDESELTAATDRAADALPNLALPAMNGAGAMEIFVSAPEGVCDFISAMDTARIPEWNTWYHLMNCGLPISLSGETDFPCMSSRRVGQGRVYVQLGQIDTLDFKQWCDNLAAGRSYVSDGYAHALRFRVNGRSAGGEAVRLTKAGDVSIEAEIALAPEIPQAVAYGSQLPPEGKRMVGDTVNLHRPRTDNAVRGGQRLLEIVVNGRVVARQSIPADGRAHPIKLKTHIDQSSWIAVRQFPQLHSNPVRVIVADRPIRASRESALWCAAATALLWKNRHQKIAAHERTAAKQAYDKAIHFYQKIAAECRD